MDVADIEMIALVEMSFAIVKAREYIQSLTPIKTGNLRYSSIKVRRLGETQWQIYIDEEIAPYAKYTTGKWENKLIYQGAFKKGRVRQIYRTWSNPNEGWWDNACQGAIKIIEDEMRKIKQECTR